MSKILELLNREGARHFTDVRALLEARPFRITVSEKGQMYSLRYKKRESDFRSTVVRQARGIVLEKETNRIVSWGFNKFWEYGERAPSFGERPNLRRSVSPPGVRYEKKYDGVLIKVVRLPSGELLVSTNGHLDASDSPMLPPGQDVGTATALLRQGLSRSLKDAFEEAGGFKLPYDSGHCYMFELLHPDHLTVIPAGEVGLVHLATRRLTGDFDELPPGHRFNITGLVMPPVEVKFPSFSACRDASVFLPWDDEGFVVIDADWNRIKVKSEAFKAMQRLKVGDSECEADDALVVCLTLHDATAALPPEQAPLIQDWRSRLDAFAGSCADRICATRRSSGGRSSRALRVGLESSLGGRIPRSVRSAIAKVAATTPHVLWTPREVIKTLRSSIVEGIHVGELRMALGGQ